MAKDPECKIELDSSKKAKWKILHPNGDIEYADDLDDLTEKTKEPRTGVQGKNNKVEIVLETKDFPEEGLKFILPLPPTVNGYLIPVILNIKAIATEIWASRKKVTGIGAFIKIIKKARLKLVKSDEGRDYKKRVIEKIKHLGPIASQWYDMDAMFYMKVINKDCSAYQNDRDNRCKPLQDAVCAALEFDDKWIIGGDVRKKHEASKAHYRVEVHIRKASL